MINKHLDLTNPGFDHDDGSCLKCNNGHAREVRNPKTNKYFLGCTNWPKCDNKDLLPLTGGSLLVSPEDIVMAQADCDFHDKDWW